MIIVGYQGVGKSSISSKINNFIDLESSNFFIDGKRDSNWFKIYCNLANNLSKQHFIVFISSHKEVREELKKNSNEIILTVCPSEELRDEWVQKLKDRYYLTNLEKDYKAYKNAENAYYTNTKDVQKDAQEYKNLKSHLCLIDNINYELVDVLELHNSTNFNVYE